MNILLVAGLLILSQNIYVYSEDDLPVSSTSQQDILHKIMKNGNLEDLFEDIKNYYETKNNSLNENKFSKDRVESPVECIACKLIMTALAKLLSNNPTRDAVINALSKVCNIVPFYMRGKCRNFINKYSGKIIDFLVRRNSPSQICRLIMLCSNNLYDEDVRAMDIILNGKNTLDDSTGKEEMKDIKDNEIKKEKVENPIECAACKIILKALKKILSRNPTREKIKKALGKVCFVFHGKMKRKCLKFVYKYSEKIIKYVLRKYSAKEICKKLMLCSNENPMDILSYGKNIIEDFTGNEEINNFKDSENKNDGANPVEYSMSKLMTEIKRILKNKESKEEIEDALEQVCDLIPGHLKDQCHDFSEEYGDKIVEFIMDNILLFKIILDYL